MILESDSQALITIDYKIDPNLYNEFEQRELELGRTLKSEGMGYWELFQDTTDIGHHVEIKIADTWTDHMRHHNALQRMFRFWKIKSNLLLKNGPKPTVSHYIGNLEAYFFS